MTLNSPTNVSAAFEMLIEEIEAEIETINAAGARFLQDGAYEKAKLAISHAETVTAFRAKLTGLRDEWHGTVETQSTSIEDEESGKARRNLGRLKRGRRTTEAEYYVPILNALVELGGSAPMQAVLDRIERAMKDRLKDVDYEPLASDPEATRWRNSAQWARYSLVQQGLMKGDSPRGTWEISEAGRTFLADASV